MECAMVPIKGQEVKRLQVIEYGYLFNDLDICKVDMRFIVLKRPVALGILLYLCSQALCISWYRKEVNSIISRISEKKKLCTENGMPGLKNDSGCFHSPPGLWKCYVSCMLWLCMYISDEILELANQSMSVRSRFVRMSSKMAMLLREQRWRVRLSFLKDLCE